MTNLREAKISVLVKAPPQYLHYRGSDRASPVCLPWDNRSARLKESSSKGLSSGLQPFRQGLPEVSCSAGKNGLRFTHDAAVFSGFVAE